MQEPGDQPKPAGERWPPRLPELSDELYLGFREMLRERCGLHYPERKRGDLAHGLTQAMNGGGYPNLEALYADATASGPAWETIVAHLTIGETYFFRNRPQFAALEQHVLPELLQRRASIRSLRFWSAACATGEEPYSLAMLLGDLLPPDAFWQASILATDINPRFLARAREGLYSEWSFRETTAEQRARFWTAEGNRWRIQTAIRRMVVFARLNLAEPSYPAVANGTCAMDIIFCRNVMIYFDEATIRMVLARLYGALAPGGWLFVGHAEPQVGLFSQFEVHNFPNAIIYRKPLDAPPFTPNLANAAFDPGG
jgi:chemotaxis protein methyltransferase CheR